MIFQIQKRPKFACEHGEFMQRQLHVYVVNCSCKLVHKWHYSLTTIFVLGRNIEHNK